MTLEECYIQYKFLKSDIGLNTINFIKNKYPNKSTKPYLFGDIMIFKDKDSNHKIILPFKNIHNQTMLLDYNNGSITLYDYNSNLSRVRCISYFDINKDETVEVWI